MLKTKNKILYIVLAVLAVALIINTVRTNIKGERSFRTSLVEFDPQKIDQLVMVNNSAEIKFTRDKELWMVAQESKSNLADVQSVENILKELSTMKIERLVTKEKSKLREFEVDDTLGVAVQLFSKGKKVADLVVGRFSYRQTGNRQGGIQLSTMIRLANETDVYSIEGALSMSVKRDFDSFRDKTLVRFDPDKVQSMEFTYPSDSSFTLTRGSDVWFLNRDTVDTGKVINFLNDIKETRGNSFTTDFDPAGILEFQMKATLSGEAPIVVKAYQQGEKYVFVSSQNESSLSDSEHLFKRVFASKRKFAK
jgi:hypothetical protein